MLDWKLVQKTYSRGRNLIIWNVFEAQYGNYTLAICKALDQVRGIHWRGSVCFEENHKEGKFNYGILELKASYKSISIKGVKDALIRYPQLILNKE